MEAAARVGNKALRRIIEYVTLNLEVEEYLERTIIGSESVMIVKYLYLQALVHRRATRLPLTASIRLAERHRNISCGE